MIRDKIKKQIANNLKSIRLSLNMNQQRFADELNKFLKERKIRANYTNKNISDWESGTSIPQMETLIGISKRFNLSLDELLKEEVVNFESILLNNKEDIYEKFKDNKDVFVLLNGKLTSYFDNTKYKFGKLSYMADNLIKYKSSFSKNFSVVSPKKEVAIITALLDVNDGKREVHFLGNKKEDILSIDNLPENYQFFDSKNACEEIFYNELGSNYSTHIVKLGDGKQYNLKEKDISNDYKIEDYCFTDKMCPKDKEDDVEDWITYMCLNNNACIDENIFDCESIGVNYYKNAGVFVCVCYGLIKISDTQLIEILSEDYKYRLINTLLKISDKNIYEDLKKEINNYELKN